MLASEIAGTPLANIAERVALELAGDVSNTEPWINTLPPTCCCAITVVELGPLPKQYRFPSNTPEAKR